MLSRAQPLLRRALPLVRTHAIPSRSLQLQPQFTSFNTRCFSTGDDKPAPPPLSTFDFDAVDAVEDYDAGLTMPDIKVSRHLSSDPLQHPRTSTIEKIQEMQTRLSAMIHNQDGAKAEMVELSLAIIKEVEVSYPESLPHPALARAYNDDGYVHKRLGNFDAAIESYHKAIMLYRESIGKATQSYCSVLTNLALCYKDLSTYDSEANQEQVQDANNLMDRPKHAEEPMTPMERVGYLTRSKEAIEESVSIRVQLLKRAMSPTADEMEEADKTIDVNKIRKKLRKDIIGNNIIYGGIVMSQAIAVLTQHAPAAGKAVSSGKDRQGRNKGQGKVVFTKILTAAETILREALNAVEKSGGGEFNGDREHGNAHNSLGLLLKMKGALCDPAKVDINKCFDEAMINYEAALQIRRAVHTDPHHEDIITTIYSMAELYEYQGDEKKANELREFIMSEIMGEIEAEEDAAKAKAEGKPVAVNVSKTTAGITEAQFEEKKPKSEAKSSLTAKTKEDMITNPLIEDPNGKYQHLKGIPGLDKYGADELDKCVVETLNSYEEAKDVMGEDGQEPGTIRIFRIPEKEEEELVEDPLVDQIMAKTDFPQEGEKPTEEDKIQQAEIEVDEEAGTVRLAPPKVKVEKVGKGGRRVKTLGYERHKDEHKWG
jgi:tetratricopeptide (TPR) repeat protein